MDNNFITYPQKLFQTKVYVHTISSKKILAEMLMRIMLSVTRDPRRVRRHYNNPCITIVPLHCLLVLTCDYIFFFFPQANVNFTLAVVDLEYRDPHYFFFSHVIIVQSSSYSYLAMRCAILCLRLQC